MAMQRRTCHRRARSRSLSHVSRRDWISRAMEVRHSARHALLTAARVRVANSFSPDRMNPIVLSSLLPASVQIGDSDPGIGADTIAATGTTAAATAVVSTTAGRAQQVRGQVTYCTGHMTSVYSLSACPRSLFFPLCSCLFAQSAPSPRLRRPNPPAPPPHLPIVPVGARVIEPAPMDRDSTRDHRRRRRRRCSCARAQANEDRCSALQVDAPDPDPTQWPSSRSSSYR